VPGDDDITTIRIRPGLEIPLSEIDLRASRSSGPGGQSVNTTSSKIELRWDLVASPTLSPAQRELAMRRLGSRLTDDGVLVLQGSEHRSQLRNKEAVLQRLVTLLADALTPERPRRATRPTKGSKERRLDEKRTRSTTKRLRQPPQD